MTKGAQRADPKVWWHRADRPQARARLKRRAFPIHAYIGPNGSGKSYAAVYDSMASLDFGRPVLSTVRLLDWRNPGPCPGGDYCDDPANHDTMAFRWDLLEQATGPALLQGELYSTCEGHKKKHPLYFAWTTYQRILAWRDGDVLADEITGFASSREIKNMPPQVANYLVQLRRRNVTLRWTTPSWGRADTIIREVTQAVTLCVGQVPKRRAQVVGEAPRIWRDNRAFMVRTYDPHDFDEVEARRLENAKPNVWAWYWRPKALAGAAYDTLDVVTALGWANEAGVCISCGGERRRNKCACPADHSKGHLEKATQGAGLGSGGPTGERSEVGPDPAPQFSPFVQHLLPSAQHAADVGGQLDLVDAIVLSAAEWQAEQPD